MNEVDRLAELEGYLYKFIEHCERISTFYDDFCKDADDLKKGKSYDLIVLADIFTDFYTFTETAFVRISKYFENNLDRERWHSHLLEKMVIDVPGIRKRVISDHSYSMLLEFMKFRHFRRYYFEFEYDRDRMTYLEKKFMELLPLLKIEIQEYILFCKDLQSRV